ncbi:MAG: hypothetical protein M3O35_21330 [Acidobacteriota bacterium]|nr:hypothetical protein [Acidobacteriota bacterium]
MDQKHRLGDWEDVFRAVRTLADAPGLRHIIVVRQNQNLLCMACPERSTVRSEFVAEVERIVPSDGRRNIAVIAPTQPKLEAADVNAIPGTLDVITMGRVIPFFGMLIGFTSIQHRVWVFDGQPDAFIAGCRDADLLIIDSAAGGRLTTTSLDLAAPVMRNANILIHDRKTGGLRAVRQAGTSKDRLEFRCA